MSGGPSISYPYVSEKEKQRKGNLERETEQNKILVEYVIIYQD